MPSCGWVVIAFRDPEGDRKYTANRAFHIFMSLAAPFLYVCDFLSLSSHAPFDQKCSLRGHTLTQRVLALTHVVPRIEQERIVASLGNDGGRSCVG